MNIFSKFFSLDDDTDKVILADFHLDPNNEINIKRAKANDVKRAAAKAWLGKKWIGHPVNRVIKENNPKDYATADRQKFIRSVK